MRVTITLHPDAEFLCDAVEEAARRMAPEGTDVRAVTGKTGELKNPEDLQIVLIAAQGEEEAAAYPMPQNLRDAVAERIELELLRTEWSGRQPAKIIADLKEQVSSAADDSRPQGFYWVKWESSAPNQSSWCPTWWCDEMQAWWCDDDYQDSGDVVAVGPRIPMPNEPWQCVPKPGATDAMCDATRAFLMLLGSDTTYEQARSHCVSYHGPAILEDWPAYAIEGSGHIPKTAQADILYRMMLAAAPKP